MKINPIQAINKLRAKVQQIHSLSILIHNKDKWIEEIKQEHKGEMLESIRLLDRDLKEAKKQITYLLIKLK